MRKYRNGDKKALDELIENNTRIIYKIAKKYNGINRELDIDDLIQEGTLGLIAAANKYDLNYEKKAKFITFAVYYIDRYIHSCVNGRSSKQVGNNMLYRSCTSLSSPIGEEDEARALEEIVGDIDYGFENIDERIYLNKLREDLEKAMEQYNTLEQREVLKFRYGWNTKQMTLNDISEILDISREKTRNIEKIALRKLRNSSWAMNNIKEFAELGYIDKFHLEIFRDWGIDI